MRKILSPKFFKSRNTVKIAKGLLGKFLVRRYKGKIRAYTITEVEAYDGFKDKASHAHRGQTERNKVMFGLAGHWYVYFTYGVHWMLNIVTGPKEYPAAVLIRSIRADSCHGAFNKCPIGHLLNGPAKLTKALHIDKKLNGQLASRKSGLWIEDRGIKIGNPPLRSTPPKQSLRLRRIDKASADDFHSFKRMKIKKGPRVGVDYAGPIWSKKHYRFTLTP